MWAKTAADFIESGERESRLKSLQEHGLSGGNLSELYNLVIQDHFGKSPDAATLDAFHAVVGLIVFAKRPLLRNDISSLLELKENIVDYMLARLQSVMEHDDMPRFSHQSFVDFLLDAESCPPMFLLKQEVSHRRLALAAFRTLKAGLRFNICELETSYVRNADVADLDSRISKAIPTHLIYSCLFWANHLQFSPSGSDILEEAKDFMHSRLLWWLEVMSLVKEVNAAPQALEMAAKWGRVNHYHFRKIRMKLIDSGAAQRRCTRCSQICSSFWRAHLTKCSSHLCVCAPICSFRFASVKTLLAALPTDALGSM
jgi:hypothetical protein